LDADLGINKEYMENASEFLLKKFTIKYKNLKLNN
jgi:hypothetical protein